MTLFLIGLVLAGASQWALEVDDETLAFPALLFLAGILLAAVGFTQMVAGS